MMTFDKSLQGSLGVIRTLEDVKNSYIDCERRFFVRRMRSFIHQQRIVWYAANGRNLILTI